MSKSTIDRTRKRFVLHTRMAVLLTICLAQLTCSTPVGKRVTMVLSIPGDSLTRSRTESSLCVLVRALRLRSLEVSATNREVRISGDLRELKSLEEKLRHRKAARCVARLPIPKVAAVLDTMISHLSRRSDSTPDAAMGDYLFESGEKGRPSASGMIAMEGQSMFLRTRYAPLFDSLLADSAVVSSLADGGLKDIGMARTESRTLNGEKVVEFAIYQGVAKHLIDIVDSIDYRQMKIARRLTRKPGFGEVVPEFKGIAEDTLAQHIMRLYGREALDSLLAFYQAMSDSLRYETRVILPTKVPVPILYLSEMPDEHGFSIVLQERIKRLSVVCGGLDELYTHGVDTLSTWDSMYNRYGGMSPGYNEPEEITCGKLLRKDSCAIFYYGSSFGYRRDPKQAKEDYRRLAVDLCLGMIPADFTISYTAK